MSVGGRIIEIRRMRAHPTEDRIYQDETGPIEDGCVVRLWVVDRDNTESCVYARAALPMPQLGENVWWQSKHIYYDGDRRSLVKLGYSFSPRKDDLRAGAPVR